LSADWFGGGTTAVIGCTKNLSRNIGLASDLAAITDGAVQRYYGD
jgi:hypothetical protein